MKKEEAMKLQPFDVVVYKKDGKNIDILVKRVTDYGVFGIERIQSTAALYPFEDIELQK